MDSQLSESKLHSVRAKHFWHVGLFVVAAWVILSAAALVISPITTWALLKSLPVLAVNLFVKLPVAVGVPALVIWPFCRYFLGIKSLSQMQQEILDDHNAGLGSIVGMFYLALVFATTAAVFHP